MMGLNMEVKTEVTEEQKQATIKRFKEGFVNIRGVVDTLEVDIESTDLIMQSSAIWISGNLLQMFSDFMNHLKMLEEKQKMDKIQAEIKDVAENNKSMEGEQSE